MLPHIWKITESFQEFRVSHIWREGYQSTNKLVAGESLGVLEDTIYYSPLSEVLPSALRDIIEASSKETLYIHHT